MNAVVQGLEAVSLASTQKQALYIQKANNQVVKSSTTHQRLLYCHTYQQCSNAMISVFPVTETLPLFKMVNHTQRKRRLGGRTFSEVGASKGRRTDPLEGHSHIEYYRNSEFKFVTCDIPFVSHYIATQDGKNIYLVSYST